MDPQLLIPSQATNFNFDSTHTSPYTTAPQSPKILIQNSLFYSAPTSPKRSQDPNLASSSCVEHESSTSIDGSNEELFNYDLDFAFDFSGQLESPLISAADELFQGGKIKPLDPVQPPLSMASNTYAKQHHLKPYKHSPKNLQAQQKTKHKASRSLSPVSRVSDILSDDQKPASTTAIAAAPFGFMWCNKWNLKHLLLFRSTSEGSAMISKDSKNTSFRSDGGGGGGGSVTGGSSRRMMKRKVSAHEMHYTANRAVAEGMKRKTFLPYKSGLLGCLGFGYSHNNNNNNISVHETSFRGRSS